MSEVGPFQHSASSVVLVSTTLTGDSLLAPLLAQDATASQLLTSPTALDPRVLTEIQRVLGGSGTVYLMGGTAAFPNGAVAGALQAAGYTVSGIQGSDMYSTALDVDQKVAQLNGSSQPTEVILASSSAQYTEYYEAIVAADIAGRPGIGDVDVVLTDATTMPATSAAFLNTLDPKKVTYVCIDNPASKALAKAKLTWGVGTACKVLAGSGGEAGGDSVVADQYAFPGMQGDVAAGTIKVASDSTWYGALTAASVPGPLVLTPGGLLDDTVDSYLEAENGTVDTVDMIGADLELSSYVNKEVMAALSFKAPSVTNTYN